MATPLFWNVYGRDHELYFYPIEESYGLSLGLLEKGEEGVIEPWCDVTVVLPDSLNCKPDEAYVKNWSENEGLDTWLIKNGVASSTGKYAMTGYVRAPLLKFDLEKVREHTYVHELIQ